ncbi:hypothetical protein [Schwartzia succinivorans]|jgi:hypothetical protein|uniref:Uncharacterized protein n=1 Tax=Schwartzia succinivorans DSM 10502 TaxID=1123243 RepID=A0A1M5AC07_9FIRM|nr:hypothetical protein [Schwartzia succinivorans]SHF27828.1 hypothetical protein SAMN02745190_02275 [Schwartzia succinivorans DSM 10502]
MLLTTIGFCLIGALALGAILTRFWDSIKNWLNTVAADAVEKHLGYSWRNKMQKAVSMVDRVMNRLKNRSVVYTKESPTATYFNKTTITSEAPVSSIDEDILAEIENHGNHIVQEFEYRY